MYSRFYSFLDFVYPFSAEAKTGVFWALEDCPIPEGLNPDSVHAKIKKALENKGYGGALSIRAYGEKETFPDIYRDAGIAIVQGESRPPFALLYLNKTYLFFTNLEDSVEIYSSSRG